STTNEVSTSLPSTLPASAALARPGPIAAATSPTDTGASNGRTEPSGRRMLIIGTNPEKKVRGRAALSFVIDLSEDAKAQPASGYRTPVRVRGVITLPFRPSSMQW